MENCNCQQQYRRNPSMYPMSDQNRCGCTQPRMNKHCANIQPDMKRNVYIQPDTTDTGCGQKPACPHETIDTLPLAMSYVPWQHWKEAYPPCKALKCGTIFPELELPFRERSCGR